MSANNNPYVGPRPFHRGETLYGRDREIRDLLDLLIAERIVLFYAPSGAGKTSLVRAGLVPALEKEGFTVLPLVRLCRELSAEDRAGIPKHNPYVFSVLLSLEEVPGRDPAAKKKPAELAGMTLADYLAEAAGAEKDAVRVLIFDQFEEVLSLDPTDQPAKAAFFEQLGQALRDRHYWALFVVREDYVAALDPYLTRIPTRLSNRLRMDLLTPEAARQAIERPAANQGVTYSDEAVTRLVDDLRKTTVQLPNSKPQQQLGPLIEPVQLQVVCHRLWNRLPQGMTHIDHLPASTSGWSWGSWSRGRARLPQRTTRIHLKDLDKIGKGAEGTVVNALAEYYSECVGAAAKQARVREKDIRWWCGHQLITDQGLRTQVLREYEQSGGLSNQAIQLLVKNFLVREEQRRGRTWYELAHDRLVEPVRQSNTEYNRRRRLRRVQLALALAIPLLLAALLAFAVVQWGKQADLEGLVTEWTAKAKTSEYVSRKFQKLAETNKLASSKFRQLAETNALAAQALQVLPTQLDVALLLSVSAVEKKDTPEARASLLAALQRSPHLATFLYSRHGPVLGVAFADSGKKLAVFQGNEKPQVIPYPPQSKSEFVPCQCRDEVMVRAAALSPGGQLAATGSQDGTVALWDVARGKQLFATPNADKEAARHRSAVWSLAFSSDGKRLASGDEAGQLLLWEVKGQSLTFLDRQDGHPGGGVQALAFHKDGQLLASGSGRGPREPEQNKGKAGTNNDEGTVVLWEVGARLAELGRFRAHSNGVLSLTFWPATGAGKEAILATGAGRWFARPDEADEKAQDYTVQLWRVRTPAGKPSKDDPVSPPLKGHSRPVWSLAFSPDGQKLASGGRDLQIFLWDIPLRAGQGVGDTVPSRSEPLMGHKGPVRTLAFSRDGKRLASGGEDELLLVWDVVARHPLLAHQGQVRAIAFTPDGTRLASGGYDGEVRLWDVPKRRALPKPVLRLPDLIRSVAFSPVDANLLAVAARGTKDVLLWDHATGKQRQRLEHEREVQCVAFSPDGRDLASGDVEGGVQVWDVKTGKRWLKLSGHSQRVWSVAFDPKRPWLASASWDRTVGLWDVAREKPPPILERQKPAVLRGHVARVWGVAFSPDGKQLASSGGDNLVILWDVKNSTDPQPLASLAGHKATVESVAFSPDGKVLASAGWDNVVRLWDVERQTGLGALAGHTDQVRAVLFHPTDSNLLVSASKDTHLILWDLNINTWKRQALGIANRDLTDDERARYGGNGVQPGRAR